MKTLLRSLRSLLLKTAFTLARLRAWLRVRAARARAPRGFDCFATAAPVSPTLKGVATIVWGTIPGGTAIAPAAPSAIEVSISITPINAKAVGEIENGDGSLVTSIHLDDGFEADVETVYDAALVYPAQTGSVTLTLPTKSGSGTYPDLSSASGGTGPNKATYPCIVESNPVRFERKKEAMVTFKLSHRPGRDGAPS